MIPSAYIYSLKGQRDRILFVAVSYVCVKGEESLFKWQTPIHLRINQDVLLIMERSGPGIYCIKSVKIPELNVKLRSK